MSNAGAKKSICRKALAHTRKTHDGMRQEKRKKILWLRIKVHLLAMRSIGFWDGQ